MTTDAFGDHGTTIPDYPTTIKRIFVYTAACGIWLRCSYKLPDPITKVCDDPWNGPAPDYPGGADRWVDHWRWHSCGEVCCKKVFEVCKENYVTKGGTFIKIKALTKEKYPGSECSKQGDFTGPRPFPTSGTVTLDCEDGC